MIFELSSVVRILISSGNFIFLELFGVSTHLSDYVSSYVLTAHQSPFFFFFYVGLLTSILSWSLFSSEFSGLTHLSLCWRLLMHVFGLVLLIELSYCLLWCWRRLSRVPWISRRSSQSILKKINPEYLLEGLMLKLKLQYFGHLMWRTEWNFSMEKTLMLGKIEGRRRRKGATEDEMAGWHHRLNGHECEQTLGDSEEQGNLMCCSYQQSIGHDWVTEQQTVAFWRSLPEHVR